MLNISSLHTIKNEPVALLMRHSDRDKIPQGQFGDEILLNKKGIKNALVFGQKLRNLKVVKIYTSPIKRCIQTAEYILQGYVKRIDIETTKILGDPGIHVTDSKKVGEFYLKYGFEKLYNLYLENILVQGLTPKDKIVQELNSFIKKTAKENITLYITHDSLIAFYAHAAKIKTYSMDNWIDYLNGLILKTSEL